MILFLVLGSVVAMLVESRFVGCQYPLSLVSALNLLDESYYVDFRYLRALGSEVALLVES